MANNNYMQNPNNMVDLNDYYRINTSCENGVCSPSNTISPGYIVPTVEQLANYKGGEQLYPIRPEIQGQFGGVGPTVNATNQLYQPITEAQAQAYPTPAIVNAEAQQESLNTGDMGGFITDISNPYPVTRESLQYLNGFIRTQIGRRISIDFLIGSNNMVTKSGYLLAVATNYIIINELDTNDITTCDFYNIKFIRFYY